MGIHRQQVQALREVGVNILKWLFTPETPERGCDHLWILQEKGVRTLYCDFNDKPISHKMYRIYECDRCKKLINRSVEI